MTETEMVSKVKSMIDEAKDYLCIMEDGDNDEIRRKLKEEVDVLEALLSKEIVLKDEVNCLNVEINKLHAELEESKKPKHYSEILFTDGSPSVCVENGKSWSWGERLLTVYEEGQYHTIATFNAKNVRGIIKRG